MRSEIREDVVLRLADSAEGQPRGNAIVVDRLVAQPRILEAIGIGYSKPLSIDLILSLKRKLKELESG